MCMVTKMYLMFKLLCAKYIDTNHGMVVWGCGVLVKATMAVAVAEAATVVVRVLVMKLAVGWWCGGSCNEGRGSGSHFPPKRVKHKRVSNVVLKTNERITRIEKIH